MGTFSTLIEILQSRIANRKYLKRIDDFVFRFGIFLSEELILSGFFSCRIFKRVKSFKDELPLIVFDSNRIQHGSVIEHKYSPNGKFCAFTIADKEENSLRLHVIDVESGEICGKCLQLSRFGRISWSGDSMGFFIHVNINVFFCKFALNSFVGRKIYLKIRLSFENCVDCSMIRKVVRNVIYIITIWMRINRIS